MLDVGRARGRHQPEEHKDERLAETEIAIGFLGPPVYAHPAMAQSSPQGNEPQVTLAADQAGSAGHREGHESSHLDLAHRGQLAGHEPHQYHPVLVGAPRTPSA